MSKVLVKWNKTNVMSVQTGLPDASVVQFIPGANEFPVEKWNLIKDHPELKKRMETDIIDPKRGKVKMLEVISGVSEESKGDEDGQETSEGIAGLGAKEAKALVEETFNTPLLREWLESETRSSVKKAIEKQLEAIDKEREESEENKDSQE